MYQQLKKEAEESGYLLNPDEKIAKDLVKGLLVNENRYGYWSCPCRLAEGDKKEDLDIICPCDYRDEDLFEFGTCYCGLYVSKEVFDGKKDIESIRERRPERNKRAQHQRISKKSKGIGKNQSIKIWRCRVCGYLCARANPPLTCPVCKATQDRFERFQ
ncbi:MAG: ferredoxin-thioredoxin reductase catalytic domain-containing protein [Candidatus Thermoplasmatota archaeon]|nr:ferredoxin-thioredoxin reductase catalytic domain-containing protein [Candidatus Thermoplasmatota archaeon]